MTKYINFEYDQIDSIKDAIDKIDTTKVILQINSIKDVERQVPMWKIKITNRTSNVNVVDDFIEHLNDYLELKN